MSNDSQVVIVMSNDSQVVIVIINDSHGSKRKWFSTQQSLFS